MKDVVFTEFLEFVSVTKGSEMTDDIIDDAILPHDGAYTSVGTYPFVEMQRLVAALCQRTGSRADALLEAFGGHLCTRFSVTHPSFFTEAGNLFAFLASVDRHIHVEVHKLYADAELPSFRTIAHEADRFTVDYASCRPLEALAEGMIRAASRHFAEPVTISRARLTDGSGAFTRFMIDRAA